MILHWHEVQVVGPVILRSRLDGPALGRCRDAACRRTMIAPDHAALVVMAERHVLIDHPEEEVVDKV